MKQTIPSTRKTTRRNRKNKRRAMTMSYPAPAASGYSLSPSSYSTTSLGRGHIRVIGHEMVAEVTPDIALSNSIAAIVDCNPACWVDSRLSLIAKAYERYRYNSVTVEYLPSVGTGVSGSVATAVETDATEPIPSGSNSITRTLNNEFSALCPVWQASSFKFERNKQDMKWYLASQVGESNRDAVTQFLAYALYSGSNQATTILGRIVFHYDIEFLYPELEFVDGGRQFETISASSAPAAANAPVVIEFTGGSEVGVKYFEFRLSESLGRLQQGVGNFFDALAGNVVYAAWNGAQWLLYATIEGVKTNAVPLLWLGAQAVSRPLRGRQRVLVATESGR